MALVDPLMMFITKDMKYIIGDLLYILLPEFLVAYHSHTCFVAARLRPLRSYTECVFCATAFLYLPVQVRRQKRKSDSGVV